MDYKINNEYLELTISTHGAEKQSLVSKETGISYLRDIDQYWNRHAPLLFPIVGKLRDLKTIINNKEYSMNQHGFLRDQEFEVFSQKENEIVLVNSYNEETLKMYPFKYKVYVKYTLNGKQLDTEFKVVNEDYQVIPFNYGGHPGFKLPLYENETFEDYKIVFEEEENFDAPTVMLDSGTLNFIDTIKYEKVKELQLNYKYFEIDAIVNPKIKLPFSSVEKFNGMIDGTVTPIPTKGFTHLGFLLKKFMPLTDILTKYLRASDDDLKNREFFTISTTLMLYVIAGAVAQLGNHDPVSKSSASYIPDGKMRLSINEGPSATIISKNHVLEALNEDCDDFRSFMSFSSIDTARALFDGKINAVAAIGTGDVRVGGMVSQMDNVNRILDRVALYLA
jgi:hypothetical protein